MAAEVLEALGRVEEAVAVLGALCDRLPSDGDGDGVKVCSLLSHLHWARGDRDAAREFALRALNRQKELTSGNDLSLGRHLAHLADILVRFECVSE